MTDSIDTSEREAEEPGLIRLPVREMNDEPAAHQPADALRAAMQLALEATPEQLPAALDALREQIGMPLPEPVAARYGFDGHGWQYIDGGSGSDWKTRHADAELLCVQHLEQIETPKASASGPDLRKLIDLPLGSRFRYVAHPDRTYVLLDCGGCGLVGDEPGDARRVFQGLYSAAESRAEFESMLVEFVPVVHADHVPDAGKKIDAASAPEQLDAGARKLAELFSYPWEHMPDQGRQEMRDNVIAVMQAMNQSRTV